MKCAKKLLLLLILLPIKFFKLYGSVDCVPCGISQNLWQAHSYSNSGCRQILILQELNIKKVESQKMFVNVFGDATEYVQSFGKDCGKYGLGAMPFWSGTNKMTIGTNDGKSDLDAFQFGLGEAITQGEIILNPLVKIMGTTFLNYAMFNKNVPGIYIKAQLTYGAMYINPVTEEIPAEISKEPIPYNDESFEYPPEEVRFKTLTEAWYGGYRYQTPVYQFGRLPRSRRKDLGAGDASLVLGYNMVVKPHAHFGVGAKFLYPMGIWPDAKYLLQPIFGGAGHTGLGVDISAHYTYYLGEGKDRAFTIWLQSEVQHLFPGRKPAVRSFDLKANGPGSKYLLLQGFKEDDAGGVIFTSLVPAINYTTVVVLSTFPAEGNCTVMFDYRVKNIDMGISLEIWGRSKEALSVDVPQELEFTDDPKTDYNLNHYAVIGRQLPIEDPVSGKMIMRCEPLARINKSLPAQGLVNHFPEQIKDATLSNNRIPNNYYEALDIDGGAAQRIITGKIVAQGGYTWMESKNTPHLSLYGGVELAPRKNLVDNLWSIGFEFSMQY